MEKIEYPISCSRRVRSKAELWRPPPSRRVADSARAVTHKLLSLMLLVASLAACSPAVPAATPAPPTATLVPPTVPPTPVATSSPTAVSQPSLLTKDKGAADSAEAIVKELVAAKLEAMKAKDIMRYLALINEADKEYYTEQRN